MSPKYSKLIDRIRAGEFSRGQLDIYATNARVEVAKGNQEANLVLKAIEQAKPKDLYIVFMGFCPDASIENRLDFEWRRDGICYMLHWAGNEAQVDDFNGIKVGDLVVLKKNQILGKTMKLYGHGRVTGIEYQQHAERENRYLTMQWATQTRELEVDAMGCTATVNLRNAERVRQEMPEEFQEWLYET